VRTIQSARRIPGSLEVLFMADKAAASSETTPQTARPKPKQQPRYHVVLLNDDDHTYEYVIDMLVSLFRHSQAISFKMAEEVDNVGRVIVDTTTMERAELKRDQILAFGPDRRIPRCQGSMSAIIEPAPD
jgi:ATP-dependent Clp protease adaptor protein ClpS